MRHRPVFFTGSPKERFALKLLRSERGDDFVPSGVPSGVPRLRTRRGVPVTRRLGWAVFVLWLVSAVACHPGPPVAVPSATVTVPKGCEQRFTGLWVHSVDPGFTYQGSDDGKTLTLVQLSPPSAPLTGPDAGSPPPPVVRLERTAQGFTGDVHAQATVADRVCEISFPVEVVGCSTDELRLRATPSRSIDATCQVAPMTPAPWVEQTLRRVVETDAGDALHPGIKLRPRSINK